MAHKPIPLSLRISDQDADFLAKFEADGATTPSEKVRFLLTQARERYGAERPEDAGAVARELMGRGRKRWRTAEEEAGLRSDLILKLYDRAPDLFGTLMAGPESASNLSEFEKSLVIEVARILEDVLAQRLMKSTRCYRAGVLGEELEPSLWTLRYLTDDEKGQGNA